MQIAIYPSDQLETTRNPAKNFNTDTSPDGLLETNTYLTKDAGVDISTSEPLPSTDEDHGIARTSEISTQAYTTRDDTLEATTNLGIETNTTASAFISRTSNSVNQSAIDTTAGTGTSITARNLTQDSEEKTIINELPQATGESVTYMEVDTTSDYPLEGTQAWVEAQVNNIKITTQETTSTTRLQTETNGATTHIYFTTEWFSTRPQDRNTTGMLHFTCVHKIKIIPCECINVLHRKSESNFSKAGILN